LLSSDQTVAVLGQCEDSEGHSHTLLDLNCDIDILMTVTVPTKVGWDGDIK